MNKLSSIGKLHHIGMITKNVRNQIMLFESLFGEGESKITDLPEEESVMGELTINGTMYQLWQANGEKSPAWEASKRLPEGGLHHLCYLVEDLDTALEQVQNLGIRKSFQENVVMKNGDKMNFLKEEDCGGISIELWQNKK
ncbi:methylmalonyl-coa epimerase [Anaeramoeba flamelloides]|uniref:Methylmalonyl-coa epimerase n=1 Tax=Anaeramoeba flamelloides TaxID=1746091 RepID=A0AAV7ZL65_9EUKA|nr:methylmalonyl-coa epimerase [Anaeramoeba flamelloides]